MMLRGLSVLPRASFQTKYFAGPLYRNAKYSRCKSLLGASDHTRLARLSSEEKTFTGFHRRSFTRFPSTRSLTTNSATKFVLPSQKARNKYKISPEDIIPTEEYQKIRSEIIKWKINNRTNSRVHIGPDASAYFESYDSMWTQIQEMLLIEEGDKDEAAVELSAYGPLVPNGTNIVITLMFEIDQKERREKVLKELGYVEDTLYLQFEEENIHAVTCSEDEHASRTTEDGVTSSVHFLQFILTPKQRQIFATTNNPVNLGIGHEKYKHQTTVPHALVLKLRDQLIIDDII